MSPDEGLGFLAQLEFTDDERRSIRGLGVSSAAALAHMIQASRPAFEQMIGDVDRAERIEQELRALLTADERATLDGPTPPRFPLGARLDPAPKLSRNDN